MFTRSVVLAALLTASIGCVTSSPGLTRTSADNPIVTIGAGQAEVGIGNYLRVWYVVDKQTQTCWVTLGSAVSSLDCCALRRVSEAQPYITWTSCPGDAPLPPAGAAAPAASPDAH